MFGRASDRLGGRSLFPGKRQMHVVGLGKRDRRHPLVRLRNGPERQKRDIAVIADEIGDDGNGIDFDEGQCRPFVCGQDVLCQRPEFLPQPAFEARQRYRMTQEQLPQIAAPTMASPLREIIRCSTPGGMSSVSTSTRS